MKHCQDCGRVMLNEFDGVDIIASCYNDACASTFRYKNGFPETIDDEATERFWAEIDRERIRENPLWIEELRKLDAYIDHSTKSMSPQ